MLQKTVDGESHKPLKKGPFLKKVYLRNSRNLNFSVDRSRCQKLPLV